MTPAPTPSPPATASPAASPQGSLVEGRLSTDTMARVAVDSLRLRSAPGTRSNSKIVVGRLLLGADLYVVAGPVSADGYVWWQVLGARPGTASGLFGWIAEAGRDGEVWAARVSLTCPTNPSVADLALLGGARALVCYGDRELRVRAYRRQFCGDGITTRYGAPDWIAGSFGGDSLFDRDAAFGDETANEIYGRARPSSFAGDTVHFGCSPEGTGWFDVTGHFDDSVSSECRTTIEDVTTGKILTEEPALSVVTCRHTFVYTDLDRAPGP